MSLGPGEPCEYGLFIREQADRCNVPATGDKHRKARQQVGMWHSQQREERVHVHGDVSVDTHVDAWFGSATDMDRPGEEGEPW